METKCAKRSRKNFSYLVACSPPYSLVPSISLSLSLFQFPPRVAFILSRTGARVCGARRADALPPLQCVYACVCVQATGRASRAEPSRCVRLRVAASSNPVRPLRRLGPSAARDWSARQINPRPSGSDQPPAARLPPTSLSTIYLSSSAPLFLC